MSALPVLKYSIEDFLSMEEKSPDKHEFYRGEIFAMAGASIPHNQIVSNTLISIGNFLRRLHRCQIFPSDLKIHSTANSLFTYPDLSIICGEIETLENHGDVVTNPAVIIEVLSASTQNYDRGGKFKLYRDIPSLKEYLMISSMEKLVEKYEKQPNGTWLLTIYGEHDSLSLSTIGFETDVDEFYQNVVIE